MADLLILLIPAVFAIYLVARLISAAIFKSYFTAKHKTNGKEKDTDGD